MKYFTLKEINEENFHKLMDFIELEGDKEIYLHSMGGNTHYTTMIIRELKKHTNIALVCSTIYSSGFDVFYAFAGTKYLISGAKGMVHKASVQNISIDSSGNIELHDDKCAIDSMTSQKYIEYPFLTDKELKKYKKSHDIYLDFKRLKEIFPEVEIIEPC